MKLRLDVIDGTAIDRCSHEPCFTRLAEVSCLRNTPPLSNNDFPIIAWLLHV